jgi:hypothetical protein
MAIVVGALTSGCATKGGPAVDGGSLFRPGDWSKCSKVTDDGEIVQEHKKSYDGDVYEVWEWQLPKDPKLSMRISAPDLPHGSRYQDAKWVQTVKGGNGYRHRYDHYGRIVGRWLYERSVPAVDLRLKPELFREENPLKSLGEMTVVSVRMPGLPITMEQPKTRSEAFEDSTASYFSGIATTPDARGAAAGLIMAPVLVPALGGIQAALAEDSEVIKASSETLEATALDSRWTKSLADAITRAVGEEDAFSPVSAESEPDDAVAISVLSRDLIPSANAQAYLRKLADKGVDTVLVVCHGPPALRARWEDAINPGLKLEFPASFSMWRTSSVERILFGTLTYHSDCRHQLETWAKEDAEKLRSELKKGIDQMGGNLVDEIVASNTYVDAEITRFASLARDAEIDQAAEVERHRRGAEAGDLDSQCALGTAYHRGAGVRRDYKAALKWYAKAALRGHPVAQYNMGIMRMLGRGQSASPISGYAYFLAAAENGDADGKRACSELRGLLTRFDRKLAREFSKEIRSNKLLADPGPIYSVAPLRGSPSPETTNLEPAQLWSR